MMRVTGLDMMVSVFTLLAIAVMVPMPWLLSSSSYAWEREPQPKMDYCIPSPASELKAPPFGPMSLTALWLTPAPAASHQDCRHSVPDEAAFVGQGP